MLYWEEKPRKCERDIGRAVNNIREKRRISRSKSETIGHDFGESN